MTVCVQPWRQELNCIGRCWLQSYKKSAGQDWHSPNVVFETQQIVSKQNSRGKRIWELQSLLQLNSMFQKPKKSMVKLAKSIKIIQ